MASIDLTQSVFSAQIVNRKAYDSHTWVMDIGDTYHIVCFMNLLTTITFVAQYIVELPNEETTKVTCIGTITLSSSLTLINVLFVPSFTYNLLYVSTITQSQPYCLVFLSAYCFIQDLTSWRRIGVGKAINELYLLQSNSLQQHSCIYLVDFLSTYKLSDVFSPFFFPATATYCNLSSLWHARLGHPSDPKIHL